jgi:hypothetical protein
MRKTIAIFLASAIASLAGGIALQPQKVEANPAAVAAPIAFCAGTAGFGCVLVATTIISGVVYYVWQRSDGKKTYVQKSATGKVDHGIYAKDRKEAEARCQRMAARQGKTGKLLSEPKKDVSGGIYYVCRF